VYVNTLMIRQVLARTRVARPSHSGRSPGAIAAEVAAREPIGTFTLNMHERLPLEQVAGAQFWFVDIWALLG
jgi:hypothetical protein